MATKKEQQSTAADKEPTEILIDEDGVSPETATVLEPEVPIAEGPKPPQPDDSANLNLEISDEAAAALESETFAKMYANPSTESPAELQALNKQFMADMSDARLNVISIDKTFAGHPYKGPAVMVRDPSLVRNATKLLLGQVGADDGTAGGFYMVPISKPVAYKD